VTNEEIGKKLGLTYSAVSRLRRGERLPSIGVMMAVETHFAWSVADQVKTRASHGAKAYARVLEEHIQEVINDK